MLVFYATEGRHPAWFALLVVAALAVLVPAAAAAQNPVPERQPTGPDTPLRIWLDIGTEEDDDDEECDEWLEDFDLIEAVRTLARTLEVQGHTVELYVDEGAEHTESAWRQRLPAALVHLFSRGDPGEDE